MKQKIKITYQPGPGKRMKTIESEFKLRDLDHFEAQLKYPARTFEDKRKKKAKHKKDYMEDI